jgi:Carboxypeptidase regulatory-like domain
MRIEKVMKKLHFWQRFAVAIGLIAVLGATAWAADVNGRIKGVVSDPSGAVVAGVKVTATNVATGVSFQTVSGNDGAYLFPQLPIGTYTVTAAATAFKKFQANGIVLNIDQEYVEDVHLQVGSASEVVQVNAQAVQVDTSEMQLSNVINSQQMEELPLIGRNFTGLELTLPGVQHADDRFGGNYSVSGAQTQQSSYLINGADTNDIALNTLVITPNLDAIDQFNLIEGPLNAEYDRNSGGIVSATIKEGTNHFHGDAFEFYRDTFLNTANYFQHSLAGVPFVSKYHQNWPGGVIGGPVLKDRMFFFGAYQRIQQITPESGGNVGIPSQAELGGNFSVDAGPAGTAPGPTDTWGAFTATAIPSTISIPGCTAGETWAQCAYSNGGVFPSSAINSIAKTLSTKYIPAPNSGTYGYVFSPTVPATTNQYIGRLDYALNPQNQFYGIYIDNRFRESETLPFTGATLPGFGDQETENIQQITLDYVRQFSPTLVNDLGAHYTRFNFDAVEPQTPVAPSSVGFAITPEDTKGEGLPAISVSGLNGVGFELGFSTNGPQPRIDQSIQLDDSVSKVIGPHALKFGYEGERFNVSNPFGARNNGSFGFDNTSSPYTSGDGALDFLMGVPDTYSQGSGAEIQADAFLNYFYGQDTWKMSDSLTLDYGLAYSIDTPLENHQYGGEGIACFVNGFNSKLFGGAPTDIAYPGEGGCTNSGQATTRHSELGPRVGFAWAPSAGWLSGGQKKFAVRGGVGIYYNRTEEESSLQTLETPPFGLNSNGVVDYATTDPTVTGPSFANPYTDINTGTAYANKFPYTFPTKGQTISAATWSSIEPFDISTYGPSFRAPYAENFQLGIERQLPSNIVARISYVGSLARHNQVTYESDFETAAGHAECLADPVCQADKNYQPLYYPQNTVGNNPELASVGTVGSYGNSSYHSLQAFIQKGMTHGLIFQAAYTYAHALDNGSSFENAGFGESGTRGYNQFDPALNYGDSAFDVRNNLVISPLYIVPKFAGSDFSPRNIALSGWEISGILTLAQGFPYDISYAGGTSRSLWCSAGVNFYACPDVPEQVAQITLGNPRVRRAGTGYGTWFSNGSTAFTAEPLGSFGNVHRDPYHGPGINNTNMILAKNFMVNSERGISIQLRMESDNVFNHTQFNNPTSTYGSSNLGYITGAAAGRQSQLAAKIYF